ncbi:helix-turn-helix domain-containing protein [Enterococcus faecalis]|uniref:helix-turn-helix domain-containing protein n=1 Tax=Enterococcus faecalis TaxID=1351 RepID=UPI0004596459|nr:helix-turn-helix domain-containing protein [Enterococcus faecalis]KAJ85634.1 hypothetical protein P791_1233 [Enterococcus faecalis NY9]
MSVDLNDLDLMTGAEASERWGFDRRYVSQLYAKYPERFKKGTVVVIGSKKMPTIVISREGMEFLTGRKEGERRG